MKNFLRSRRGAILFVVILGFLVRLWAAVQLPGDYDEPVYLGGAFDYSRLIQAGDVNGIIDYPENPEHPPLTRLIYSAVILPLGPRAGYSDALLLSRMVSVIFGTLAVWLLAIIDPLAGGLLAIQTYSVKYTSQAYLEAIPLFASLAALVALRYSKRKRDVWFWLSAGALGLTAAGKYSYFPIVIVILYVYFFEKKYSWKDLLLYAGLAALVFIVLDPALWRDPFNRLWNSVFFHTQYAQSEHVEQNMYTRWYQPLMWLSRSYPYVWHPGVFFYNPLNGLLSIDGIIFLCALGGAVSDWRQRRWVVVWMVSGVFFLLLWPTKWPQYTLVVIPAFCLAASTAIRYAWRKLKDIEDYYQWFSTIFPVPTRVFWVALVLFIALAAFTTIYGAVSLAVARHGWSHQVQDLTPLPSNQVSALLPWGEEQMLIGTSRGIALWKAAQGDQTKDTWTIYNSTNSPLPSDQVLSLHEDPAGGVWIGTRGGLAYWGGSDWQVFRSADLGLKSEVIHDIAIDSQDRVWIATNQGAAVYDGTQWTPLDGADSPLVGRAVLSLAVAPQPGGDTVYFGTANGLFELQPSTGVWQSIAPEQFSQRQGGVADLLWDSSGRLWVATLGSGLSRLDGDSWKVFRISNSDIPTNTVDVIREIRPGVFWIGTSYPERPGGQVSRFDGTDWTTFQGVYSGFSGSAVSDVALDSAGRIWLATLTSGVDTYLPAE